MWILQGKGSDLEENQSRREGTGSSGILALIVPGALSVSSIVLQGMGLQYISASLSMMLSGSCVIFTAILSILLLKRRLNVFHILGELLFLHDKSPHPRHMLSEAPSS